MYSKEEALRFKKDFWIEFANQYPKKWLLYNTDIKDFSFKFYSDNKNIRVMLDIECKDDEKRNIYFDKIVSLKSILEDEFLQDVIFERDFYLETGKVISRIWVEKTNISMNNKANWDEIFKFYDEKMTPFELFFLEYQDYIKDLETNV